MNGAQRLVDRWDESIDGVVSTPYGIGGHYPQGTGAKVIPIGRAYSHAQHEDEVTNMLTTNETNMPINAHLISAKVVEYNPNNGLAELRFPQSYVKQGKQRTAMVKISEPYRDNKILGSNVYAVCGIVIPFDRVINVYNSAGIKVSDDFKGIDYVINKDYTKIPKP